MKLALKDKHDWTEKKTVLWMFFFIFIRIVLNDVSGTKEILLGYKSINIHLYKKYKRFYL